MLRGTPALPACTCAGCKRLYLRRLQVHLTPWPGRHRSCRPGLAARTGKQRRHQRSDPVDAGARRQDRQATAASAKRSCGRRCETAGQAGTGGGLGQGKQPAQAGFAPLSLRFQSPGEETIDGSSQACYYGSAIGYHHETVIIFIYSLVPAQVQAKELLNEC